ncbi:MAG TPA: vanadium-dependent haloperoxidase [Longimicrobium sp.]|jgi:membrane-associated phospholipid phosphatase
MLTPRTLLPVLALVLAGCAGDAVQPATPSLEDSRPAADGRETASGHWIELTRAVLGRRDPSPLGTVRTFALVSVAQHNAVVAAAGTRGAKPSEAGAAAGAAAAVLRALYPAEQGAVAAQLAADSAYFNLGSDGDFGAGVRAGERAAAAVLAYAATDGSQAVWTGTVPVGPGFWRNGPPPAQPLGPLWGGVRPWNLASGDQFRPAPPPAFGSPEFAAALAEVRHYTDNRTPAQLQVAQFWQGGSGPGGPMGHFGAVAGGLAEAHRLGERASARMYALLYTAMMDASIGCWDAKFAYWYIRPHQADPAITTPVGRPPFPAYPSAHSCFSASAAGVLGELFPSARRDLHAQVEEAGVARLYAGLHFRFDVDAGRELGFAVARATLASASHRAIPLD